MDPPKNAEKVLRGVVYDLLEKKIADVEECSQKSKKYSKKIVDAGYEILMRKYNIPDKKELLACASIFSEYMTMFENAAMILKETNALTKLRRQDILPSDLFTKTIDDFKPEANQEIKDEIERRMNVKIVLKTTKRYKCKCGCDETIEESKQIARGDEPPTVTLQCISCFAKWPAPI